MASGVIPKKKMRILTKQIDGTTDSAGYLNTLLSFDSYIPISYKPGGSTTPILTWYFGQYGTTIYLIINRANTRIVGTLYYMDLSDI